MADPVDDRLLGGEPAAAVDVSVCSAGLHLPVAGVADNLASQGVDVARADALARAGAGSPRDQQLLHLDEAVRQAVRRQPDQQPRPRGQGPGAGRAERLTSPTCGLPGTASR